MERLRIEIGSHTFWIYTTLHTLQVGVLVSTMHRRGLVINEASVVTYLRMYGAQAYTEIDYLINTILQNENTDQ